MKLSTISKFCSSLALIFTLSSNAAIIDLVIDVSAQIEDPEGMTWDGQYLWVVDDTSTEMAYQIDPDTGDIINYFTINPAGVENPDTESITWDGSNLWIADSTGIIGQYTTDGTLLSTISPELLDPDGYEIDYDIEGMTWDGTNLWLADQDTGLIFKIDTDGNAIDSFDTGLGDIVSINFYNGSLWIGDTDTDDIFEIDPTTFDFLSSLDIDAILAASGVDEEYDDPYGLTWTADNELWYSDNGDEVLVRINMDISSITEVTTFVTSEVPEPTTLILFSFALLFINRKQLTMPLRMTNSTIKA